jgi:hypothetical protein
MPNSMAILISTGRIWLPLELATLYTRNRINEHPGILTESMDTTWGPPWTTTDMTGRNETLRYKIWETVSYLNDELELTKRNTTSYHTTRLGITP